MLLFMAYPQTAAPLTFFFYFVASAPFVLNTTSHHLLTCPSAYMYLCSGVMTEHDQATPRGSLVVPSGCKKRWVVPVIAVTIGDHDFDTERLRAPMGGERR